MSNSLLRYLKSHAAAHGSMPAQGARTPRSNAVGDGEDKLWRAIMSSPAQDDADDWETVEKAEAETDASDFGYYEETVAEKQIDDEWNFVGHVPTIQRGWRKVAVKAKQIARITTAAAKNGVAARRGIVCAKPPHPHHPPAQSPSKESAASAAGGGCDGNNVGVASGYGSSAKTSKWKSFATKSALKKSTGTTQLPVPKATPIETKVSYLSFESLGIPPPRSS